MSIKYLSQFESFDLEGFLKGKELVCTGCTDYSDFDTQAHLGTKVEVVIMSDTTPYKQKEGTQATNRFEKLNFKVPKDIEVPLNAVVKPVNGVAKIYGKYRNQLSIKCTDIEVIQPQTSSNQPQTLQRGKL